MDWRARTLVVVTCVVVPLTAQQPVGPPPSNPDLRPDGQPINQIRVDIPSTLNGIAHEVGERSRRLRELIDRGALAEVYVPSFEGKELALAIEARQDEVAPAARSAVARAVRQLVRAAWLLDAFGDVGNRQQVREAHTIFADAANRIQALLPPEP
jgi:hypothetical protein